MDYGIYSRPKLSRNKWSVVVGGDMSSVNAFYSSSSLFGSGVDGSGTPVGGDMSSLGDFIGATDIEDGKRGIVPAPLAGMQQMFLQGSGAWIDIPAYRWLYEWPKSEGLEKTGLGIDGDFYVQRNLTTYNLKVEGSAHFWELVIDEVKANGGQIIVSPSLFYVDWVGRIQSYYLDSKNSVYNKEGGLTYPFREFKTIRTDIMNFLERNDVTLIRARRVYMKNDDSNKRIRNECDLFDMMRCRTFNIQAGVYHNIGNKDYWSFVLGMGEETFVDDDNVVHEAMYIDLAYSMKTSDGRYIPFGSTFYPIGWQVPEGWVPQHDIYELKKVSREMYDSTIIVDEEYPEEDEMNEITTYVLLIRGMDDSIQYLLGNEATNRILEYNELKHLQRIVDFISKGTLSDDPDEIVGLILENQFPEKYGIRYMPEETDEQVRATRDILGINRITKGPTSEEEGEENYEENGEKRLDYLWFYEHDYTSEEYTVKWQFGHGIFDAGIDDSLACLGNLMNPDRMNAIVISASTPIDPEVVPPSICQYHMIDVFGESISKFRMTTIAKNGNEFYGNFLVNNNGKYINVNEQIELYIKDLNTNLELVGIHLDGENSTIKMVGNIELHQHAGGDDDTLSIWDGQERKRLEMIPRDIPRRGSEESTIISDTRKYFNTTDINWTATQAYITVDEHKEGGFLFFGRHSEYDYQLYQNSSGVQYGVTCTATLNLGNIPAGKVIDISSTFFSIDSTRTYLNGKTYPEMLRQLVLLPSWGNSVGPVTIKLKRNGTTIMTLTPYAAFNSLEEGKIYTLNTGSILEDYTSLGGDYSLEYSVVAYLYGLIANIRDNYTAPYFNGVIRLSGYADTYLADERSDDTTDMSLSKMIIGTNGMVFNASNSRYFYAGSDGYELKWDAAKIRIDSQKGVLISPIVKITSGGDIGDDAGIVVANSNGLINLPYPGITTVGTATDVGAGDGKEITVYGAQGLTINGRITIYIPTYLVLEGGLMNIDAIKIGLNFHKETAYGLTTYTVPCLSGTLTFVAVNGRWRIKSGIDWALGVTNS